MGSARKAGDWTSRLSSLGVVCLLGLGMMRLAYAVMEAGGDEVGLVRLGAAMIFFAGPFFLATYAIIAFWSLIRARLSALGALWTLGGMGIGLAFLADEKAGPDITSLLLLRRAIVRLGPCFLAAVSLAWLLDRRGRRPSRG